MTLRFASACFGLVLASCADFDDPEPLDPTPILGCYTDDSGEKIDIQIDGLSGLGLDAATPYEYQYRRSSMVIAAPIVAKERDGSFTFEPSDTHFYNILWSEGRPWLKLASDPDGVVRKYRRISKQPCS